VLGKYRLHFHLLGSTRRGASVVGASIWDSANRWVTIHGTNFLVVRDCVGYNSIGHGFFLEDGTEQYNVLDHNLAVQARHAKELPQQVLPFDHNAGGGFWWGNCLNTFTRNVAAECDEYGFRFDMQKTADFDPELTVQGLDGKASKVDVRTQPYVRFEDNESHCQRRHSYNLGGFGINDSNPSAAGSMSKFGVAGVGPDQKHPMIIRNCRAWNTHWAFHSLSPYVMLDHFDVFNAEYCLWFNPWKQHAYRDINLTEVKEANFPGEKGVRDVGLPKDQFPNGIEPVDDLPPQTVITHVLKADQRKLRIRGTTSDNGDVKQVLVNGKPATSVRANFAEWEIVLDDPRPASANITAYAEDTAGNVEKLAHVVSLPAPASAREQAPNYPPLSGPPLALATPRQDVEWTMEVGCQHCHFSEDTGIKTCSGNCGPAARYKDKVYYLRGNTSKEFGKGGIWLVKGALSGDGRTVVVTEMKMTAAAEEDSAASVAAPASENLEWTGVVFHTGKFLPSLTVGSQKYGLKPAKSASSEVKATLTRIGGGELTGYFKIGGTTYNDDVRDWIVVEAIAPVAGAGK